MPKPPDTEAIMSIHFTSPSPNLSHTTSDPAPPTDSTPTPSDPDRVDRVETIDMKHLTNSEILNELIRVTGAFPVEPTPEEREEMRMLEEQRVRSERDAKESAEVRARVRRERELLEQARGDMVAQAA